MTDLPTPQQQLEEIEARYRFRFAGHARVSRDPDLIDDMLADLERLASGLGADDPLMERIVTDQDLYARERVAIEEARAVPGAIQAFRLRLWGDLVIGRYRRGFAGRSRYTRDAPLLDEIRASLGRLRSEMSAMDAAAPHLGLASAIQNVSRNIDLSRQEADRIRQARSEGTQEDQGTRLAQQANAQFQLYQSGFAGQSRLSRHPPRLERIVSALEELGAAMTRLQRAGFDNTSNDRNIGVVTERMRAYRAELQAMRAARSEAPLDDRVNALGGAANRIFGQYREGFAGKDRAEADAERLDTLIEELFPIALEMDAIDQDHGHETNERNLGLVLDQLLLYQREWDAIREAAPAPRP